MLRKITKSFGRYREGEEHDYPRDIWERLSQELKQPLDKFSVPVQSSLILQNPLKGSATIHKRTGATQ